MKTRVVATIIALAFSATMVAPVQAMTVISSSGKLESTDPTTNGRLFRDANPSSWSTLKAFPGISTSGASFAYDLVSVDFAANGSQDVFYRISYQNETTGGAHSTAYNNLFDPLDFSTNYLGDSGSSPTPGFPVSYDVKVTAGNKLVLHFGDTGGGLPNSYTYQVEAFSDAKGGENFGAVPEPATWGMMLLGFAVVGYAMRRKTVLRYV